MSISNLIRHKNGYIQKLGGCQKFCTQMIAGIGRALFAWADLVGDDYLAIGTTERLELYFNGQLSDITPIEATSNLTTPFTTTSGSSIVSVEDMGHDPNVGDWIDIVNATFIDGIFLQGYYQVLTASAPNYTFDSGQTAIAGVSGGGAVLDFTTTMGQADVQVTLGTYAFFNTQSLSVGVSTAVGGVTLFGPYTVTVTAGPTYKITAGGVAGSSTSGYENSDETRIAYLMTLPPDTVPSGAYGAGPYGAGLYGTGAGGAAQNDQVQWSLDKWGGDLLAAYATGALYEWVPPISSGNVAQPVSGAPQALNGFMTAAPEQQVVAWGIYSSVISEQDPLLVGWCDVANLNVWTASTTNQAGTFRLSTGSRIVGGVWFGLSGLLWTDLDVWAMTYIGFPLVYSFNKIAENCGLIAPRAAAVLGTIVAWMEEWDFFVYAGGAVQPLVCTVRDFVFNNLDRNYLGAIFSAPNTVFNEIAWWFPTIGSNGIPNAYVKWNVTENLWDYGYESLQVTAWTDHSVLGTPIGSFENGYLEQFETSNDFDGAVLTSGFTTGWFELAEGEEFLFLERILPDFVLSSGGQITIQINVADDMAAVMGASVNAIRVYGPYTVTATTEYFIVRARGRVAQIVLLGTTPNTFWRYGKPLAVVSADGRR